MAEQFEARPDVQTATSNFCGPIATGCQHVRLTNMGPDDVQVTVGPGAAPFTLQADQSWGLGFEDPRIVIATAVQLDMSGASASTLVRIERVFLVKIGGSQSLG